jgi:hypothetical protein
MRYSLPAFLFAALLSLPTPSVHAKSVMVGTSETIHRLQDVSLTGPKGEKLYLGYKTSITMFIAGVWLSKDGYVLGIQGEDKRYFEFPETAALQRFQKSGALPNPLPAYELSALDYLWGYSLWLLIGTWIAGAWIWTKWKNRKAAPSQTSTSGG